MENGLGRQEIGLISECLKGDAYVLFAVSFIGYRKLLSVGVPYPLLPFDVEGVLLLCACVY